MPAPLRRTRSGAIRSGSQPLGTRPRLDPEALAQVVGGGAADADDRVGGASASGVRGARRGGAGARWERAGGSARTSRRRGGRRPRGRRAARSARPTAWADSGGELVITQSNRSRRFSRSARAAGERRPGGDQRLGHDHPAERVRPARVGVGVEQGVDPIVAVQAGAQALQVGACGHAALLGGGVAGRRTRRSSAPSPDGRAGAATWPSPPGRWAPVSRDGRIEVGDEEQVQPVVLPTSSRSPPRRPRPCGRAGAGQLHSRSPFSRPAAPIARDRRGPPRRAGRPRRRRRRRRRRGSRCPVLRRRRRLARPGSRSR